MGEFLDLINLVVTTDSNARLRGLERDQSSARNDDLMLSMVVDLYSKGKEQAKFRQSLAAFTFYAEARVLYGIVYELIKSGEVKLKMTELLDKLDEQLLSLLENSSDILITELADSLRILNKKSIKVLSGIETILITQRERLKDTGKNRRKIADEVASLLNNISEDIETISSQILFFTKYYSSAYRKGLGPQWNKWERILHSAEDKAIIHSDWADTTLDSLRKQKVDVKNTIDIAIYSINQQNIIRSVILSFLAFIFVLIIVVFLKFVVWR